jgi:hypothetical protein
MIWLTCIAFGAPQLALVSPGAEPRALLVMAPTAGARAIVEILTTSHAVVELAGPLPSPPPTTTTRTMTIEVDITSVTAEGFELQLDLREISVKVEPPPPREPPLDPATLRGCRGTLQLARSGRVLSSYWTLSDGLNERQRRAAQALLASVVQLLAPLPDEPVGPGAVWTVEDSVDAGLLQLPLQMRWELVSAEPHSAMLRNSVVTRLGETELPSADGPIQGKITALRADGSARVELPFDGLLGPRRGSLTLHAELSGWKGMIPVQLVVDVTQEQILTRRP